MDLRERADGHNRHPWEASRARFFRRLISEHAGPVDAVLDVGSGDSWLATQLLTDLPPTAQITCLDANYSAADLAEDVAPRIQRTADVPSAAFPLVLALDVLEHIADDAAFVTEVVAPAVQTGGLLIASVPAHPWLFTSHDRALGHFRRHSRASLRTLLAPSFTIEQQGSLFFSLLAPRAAQRVVEQVRPPRATGIVTQSEWKHGDALTGVVGRVLDADARLGLASTRTRLPLPGLSLWAVCRSEPRR